MKVTATPKKIDREASVNGYMVQMLFERENAPQIDYLLSNGGPYDVTIEPKKKRRTLRANNYLWVLCDEIAKAVGTDKESVYKELIYKAGVFDFVLVKPNAGNRFLDMWNKNGLGWWAEEVPYEGEARQFMVFYGTSVYTTYQMGRIIDEAVYEAKEVGVQTVPEEELERIKSDWP